MVWIFGGGFYYGSPSLSVFVNAYICVLLIIITNIFFLHLNVSFYFLLYDGRALAVTGNVVVVNINYRVGPFGCKSHLTFVNILLT